MIPVTYYVCPHCGAHTSHMRLSQERIEPTPEQLAAHPEFHAIASEILLCLCGEPLTWFDLEVRQGEAEIPNSRESEAEIESLTQTSRFGASVVYKTFSEGYAAGIVPDAALRLREWAQRMQPNESPRQAMAGLGITINLERLSGIDEAFEKTRQKIEELMAGVSGCPLRLFRDEFLTDRAMIPEPYNKKVRPTNPTDELVATLHQRLTELWPEDEIEVEPKPFGDRARVLMHFMLKGQRCGIHYNTPDILAHPMPELIAYTLAEVNALRVKLEMQLTTTETPQAPLFDGLWHLARVS